MPSIKPFIPLAASSALLVASFSHAAAASDDMVTVYQVMKCGVFMENASNKVVRSQVGSFARGFASGQNLYNKAQITEKLPDSTVALYVEKFCREHPLEDVSSGIFRMAKELVGDPVR